MGTNRDESRAQMMGRLWDAAEKAGTRRFTGEPLSGFGPLLPSDSLVERMELIWNLPPHKPRVIVIEYGSTDGDTGAYVGESLRLTRAEAAHELRRLRHCGHFVQRCRNGNRRRYYTEEMR